jgi:CNT family concentrative nucleoside transporter
MEIIVINPISYLMQDGRYMGIFGIMLILLVAFLFSNNKRRINIRLVATALLMQFCLAFVILKTTIGQNVFATIASGFEGLYGFATIGSEFLFGRLADASGPWGMVFAIKVLPTIIFFGALMAVLYHLGIVQIFVKGLAFLIRPLLGTSGAETLSVAANSMLGQTEAPLLIKNYLKNMTQSEMLVVMVGGMSHLSGSLLAVYGSMGVPIEHLLASTIMAIPGAIMIAKILIPQTEVPETAAGSSMKSERETSNILDAVSTGTSDGLRLAVNVAAMLIAFISLMAMINHILLSSIGMSLDAIFAEGFYLVAYMLGVPFKDSRIAGSLLGQKLVINEFVAYMSFVKADLAARSRVILTYALAGFSNFSCIGIQIGGLGALCPERRQMIIKLGLTALLGGTLTNFLNAAIAGLLV